MFSQQDAESIFFMTMYKLKKYCEDSAFQIERTTDEKNIELLSILQAVSFETNNEIKQEIQGLLVIQRKAELFQTILQHVKSIIKNPNKFNSLPKDSPKDLETILWLLRKFKSPVHLNEVRDSIQTAYGSTKLAYLEQFQHVNLQQLEKKFELEISPDIIKKYISQLKELYMPQNDSTKNRNGMNNGHTNSPGTNAKNNKLNLNNNPTNQKIQNNKHHDPPEPMVVEEPAMMNRSNGFNFKKNSSNLQISIIKGLKKDNIEFYDQIEPALRKAGEMFIDETFPPELSSLTSTLSEFQLAQRVVWRRISEVYRRKNITLCSDQIGPNDIHQGQLGDCYFLSALSVLAEKKKFIQRLFHSKEISSTGCYSIWLCDSGEWKNIIIDDFIPCYDSYSGSEPCFSKSKGNDIWVLLLEKAFAKLYGNYHNIDGGLQSEALAALTGAPTKYFSLKENGLNALEQLWLFIIGSLQNKFLLTGASRGEDVVVDNQRMGIVSNHAYAVLDAQEVMSSTGELYKLIKIRNPWGKLKWRGDWGDDSPHWTPQTRQLLGHDRSEGGIFWMSLLDFDTHFDSVCSCEVHDDYYFSFLRLGENRKQNYFISKLTTNEDGFVYLTVQQKMKKHFRKNSNYDYSYVRVFLAKLGANGEVTSLVHGKYKCSQSVVIRKNLQKGSYLVFIEVDWTQRLYNEINLTSYSGVKVDMQEEPLSNYNIPTLYEDLLKAYIHSSGNKKIKTKQYESDGHKVQVFQHKLDKFGLVGILISNREKNVVIHNRFTLTQLANMELYAPIEANGVYVDLRVPGGQEKMVILKAKIEYKGSNVFSYQYTEMHKLLEDYTREQLKQICRQRGQKTQSLNGGKIERYTLKYLGGFADYYVNKGTEGVLQEEIHFDCHNVLINGEDVTRLEIFVLPGEDFVVDIKINNVFESSRYNRQTNSLVV